MLGKMVKKKISLFIFTVNISCLSFHCLAASDSGETPHETPSYKSFESYSTTPNKEDPLIELEFFGHHHTEVKEILSFYLLLEKKLTTLDNSIEIQVCVEGVLDKFHLSLNELITYDLMSLNLFPSFLKYRKIKDKIEYPFFPEVKELFASMERVRKIREIASSNLSITGWENVSSISITPKDVDAACSSGNYQLFLNYIQTVNRTAFQYIYTQFCIPPISVRRRSMSPPLPREPSILLKATREQRPKSSQSSRKLRTTAKMVVPPLKKVIVFRIGLYHIPFFEITMKLKELREVYDKDLRERINTILSNRDPLKRYEESIALLGEIHGDLDFLANTYFDNFLKLIAKQHPEIKIRFTFPESLFTLLSI